MKSKIQFKYCNITHTLRQMPQNYLIAYKAGGNGPLSNWCMDPDMAADKKATMQIAELIFFNHDIHYGHEAKLLMAIKDLGYDVDVFKTVHVIVNSK